MAPHNHVLSHTVLTCSQMDNIAGAGAYSLVGGAISFAYVWTGSSIRSQSSERIHIYGKEGLTGARLPSASIQTILTVPVPPKESPEVQRVAVVVWCDLAFKNKPCKKEAPTNNNNKADQAVVLQESYPADRESSETERDRPGTDQVHRKVYYC
jgi:hypothetical protein